MISTSSLAAFSTNVSAAQHARNAQAVGGVQRVRSLNPQSTSPAAQAQPTPARPGTPPGAGQMLPRGSLLNLSV